MTTGPRLVQWLMESVKSPDEQKYFSKSYVEKVFNPNCIKGREFAENIRLNSEELIIDPTCFNPEGWTQDDYLSLWCIVIKRYCKEVCFNEGWEYSNGCVREYLTAKQCKINTTDCSRKHISTKKAINMIINAIFNLEKVNAPSKILMDLLHQIQSFSG